MISEAKRTGPVVLEISDLTIVPVAGGRPAVRNAGFRIHAGETLAIIGESGSGKSTISMACLGHVRPGLRVAAGSIRLLGTELIGADIGVLRRIRGQQVAYVAQSAAASFNPASRIDPQVIEPSLIHGTRSREAALERAHSLYRRLNLPTPDTIGRRYPHQVSGGQLQRFMLAMGLMEDPQLLVLDEPTSALDATTQVEVLAVMRDAVRGSNRAAIFVSHDLPVVAQMADRILVMRHGEVVEEGPAELILNAPGHPYTRELVAAFRSISEHVAGAVADSGTGAPAQADIILSASGLDAGYGIRSGGGPAVLAVNSVDFSLVRSRILAVVGESGSGKSSLAQVIAGLLPPSRGVVKFNGCPLSPAVGGRSKNELRAVQILFQMADTALNPQRTVGQTLGRVLWYFHRMPRDQRRTRIAELLEMVRLPAHYASRLPGQLSGGEKQRVTLARALAAEPEVLICDEITSALDTLVGTAILELIDDLRRRLALSVIFISHDLPKVASIADEILVMRLGKVVEVGPAGQVLTAPQHPYTRLLIQSSPEMDRGWLEGAAERSRKLVEALGN